MVETIPSFGLGTFRVDAEKTANAVKSTLQLGYRHIDTAKFYNNEEAVGKGVRDSLVPRESIWVTTKVWHDQLRRDDVVKSLIDRMPALDRAHGRAPQEHAGRRRTNLKGGCAMNVFVI
jgi:2,5-diketo-D-gluconate reductase B